MDSFTPPPWSDHLSNLYWFLRYYGHWDPARRRKLYRQIAAERTRLQETGIDREIIRLLCRCLANPKNRTAAARYQRVACTAGIVTKA